MSTVLLFYFYQTLCSNTRAMQLYYFAYVYPVDTILHICPCIPAWVYDAHIIIRLDSLQGATR